jgi:hypothetical protein
MKTNYHNGVVRGIYRQTYRRWAVACVIFSFEKYYKIK